MTDYQQITYEIADGVATIRLNRPEQRNGYTVRMANELEHAFSAADADDDVRVVVFAAAGKDFCVGADLSGGGFDLNDGEDTGPYREPAGRCSMRIYAMNKPVIAAIQGIAVGAGSTIALPADFRLASNDARFGYVFTRRGIVPEGASTWFLPRLVGLTRAMDWMVSGRIIGADEALSAGLVTSVHEPSELLDQAYELARTIATQTAPVSVAVTRRMLLEMSAKEAPYPVQELDSRLIADSISSPDAAEGVASFLERRSPSFPMVPSKDLPSYLPWTGEELQNP